MTLAYDIQWLLNVLKNYLARFFKTCDLHFDNFTNTFLVFLYISDAVVILDHSRDTKVEAAKYDSVLYILDKGQDVGVDLKIVHVQDIAIDESIANTFPGITQDLVIKLCGAFTLVDLAIFCDVVNDLLVEDVHSSHFFIDLR